MSRGSVKVSRSKGKVSRKSIETQKKVSRELVDHQRILKLLALVLEGALAMLFYTRIELNTVNKKHILHLDLIRRQYIGRRH